MAGFSNIIGNNPTADETLRLECYRLALQSVGVQGNMATLIGAAEQIVEFVTQGVVVASQEAS